MNTLIKVLLVEDEQTLAEIIKDTLDSNGFEVTLKFNGEDALQAILNGLEADVIVSDIMMPKMDGFTLMKELGRHGVKIPVLFLTARSDTNDVVKGFELGGSDYLRKPFAIAELIARIRSLAGRWAQKQRDELQETIKIGRYTLDVRTRMLSYGVAGTNEYEQTELPYRECEVLAYLARHINETAATSDMLTQIWGDDSYFNSRSLNVYITKLRHKLQKDKTLSILNIRGVGYRLTVE